MVTGRCSGVALVTGAAGFIGRHVARRLAQEGWSVIGIGHGAWAESERGAHGVREWHAGDVSRQRLEALGDPELIVHCAGGGSVAASIANPEADFARTVATTAAVLAFARSRRRPPRIVYPSSPAVCGRAGEGAIAEDAPPAPISPYGEHKRRAEELCREAGRDGVPIGIVRLFSVYGAGLRKQLLWDACTKIAAGDLAFSGTGEEVRDWLHVEDAVELLVLAGEHAAPASPVVNGGTGIGTANRAVLQALCDRLRPGASPRFSGAARAGDPPRYVADIARARDWGWRPRRALAQGLDEYVRWFREQA